jgi:hypothetical protein
MADRRTDDTPLAPRRSLGGPKGGDEHDAGTAKRPLTDRVSAAVSSATSAVTSGSSGHSRPAPGTTGGGRGPGRGPLPSAPRSASGSGADRGRGIRKARLRLTHVDPWSVMKTAFLLSIAFGIVTVIAVAVVWSVLGAAGVWESINKTVQEVLGGDSGSTFDVENYVGTTRVMGFTMIVAVVDVVLITAIATLGAFLYNLAAALLGGLEVTLAEDDR